VFEGWSKSIISKIWENPIRNIFILIIILIIIFYLGIALFEAFGIITAIGYLFACIYGLVKIIDKPDRAVVWFGGYIIGALIGPILLESALPILKQGDWSSVIAIGVIGIVVLMLYLRSKELKNY
jgi:hypothetical protein